MKRTLITLVLAAAVSILGCDSDSEENGGAAGSGGSGGTGGSAGSGGSAGTGGSAGSGGGGGTGGMMATESFDSCASDAPGNACKCNPLMQNPCDPGEVCVVTYFQDGNDLTVPALDGSDGVTASECSATPPTPNPIGFACGLETVGDGLVQSECGNTAICVDGECVRACPTNDIAPQFGCPAEFFEVCEFNFGPVEFGACLAP